MPRRVGGHPLEASRPPRGTPGQSAGSSSRRPGGGSCLLQVAPRGARAAGDAVRCGAAQGRRGAGLGHEGAGASRCLLPPFPHHPGSACTASPQVNQSRTGKLAASCHHCRSKGRGAAQREGCWRVGGGWAGGGPGTLHPNRHYSYGRAVSDPQRLGCPVPAVSQCRSSPAEPSASPTVMDRMD